MTELMEKVDTVYRKRFSELEAWLIDTIKNFVRATCATSFVFMFSIAGFFFFYFFINLMYSRFWCFTLLYLWWMLIDTDVWYIGERRFEWVRNWYWWRLFRDHYPINLVKTADLDSKKNYIFACYPHGVLPAGPFCAFATNALNFQSIYPGLKSNMATLNINFSLPFLRDLFLALGICPASMQCLMHLLDPNKNKGRCVSVLVGGAAEALEANPGTHKIILNKRKGFVKIAIMTGSPIVPVYSFGEVDAMPQLNNPPGSLLRNLQERFRGWTGVAPVLPLGEGMKYSLGVVPLRKPIHVVVGKPIEVKRNLDPTSEEVEALHSVYKEELIKLFDSHKFKYLEDPENTHLIVM